MQIIADDVASMRVGEVVSMCVGEVGEFVSGVEDLPCV